MSGDVGDLELSASRWVPHDPARVWAACTTKESLERWWSPEDLRTTVRRFDPRPGGEVVLHIRYVPALLSPGTQEAFQAARIPLVFDMRGTVREAVNQRLLTFDLTLDIGRGGAGVETAIRLEFVPEGPGTRINLAERGQGTPHWVALGQRNLEAQLDRLAQALDASPSRR